MKRLAEESFKDKNILIKWERKVAQENKVINLAFVKNRSAFSKILIIVRELYGEGIAEDISFDGAAKIVIDEVLLKP